MRRRPFAWLRAARRASLAAFADPWAARTPAGMVAGVFQYTKNTVAGIRNNDDHVASGAGGAAAGACLAVARESACALPLPCPPRCTCSRPPNSTDARAHPPKKRQPGERPRRIAPGAPPASVCRPKLCFWPPMIIDPVLCGLLLHFERRCRAVDQGGLCRRIPVRGLCQYVPMPALRQHVRAAVRPRAPSPCHEATRSAAAALRQQRLSHNQRAQTPNGPGADLTPCRSARLGICPCLPAAFIHVAGSLRPEEQTSMAYVDKAQKMNASS